MARIVTSLARGVGSAAGWTAASLVAAGSSAIDQLGEAGEVMADSYDNSYEARASYLELTPAERKAARASALAAKREKIAAKREPAPAKGKKLVTA